MREFAPFLNARILQGISINLREVCESDAKFILSLRCDEKKARFLNKTENDPKKQEIYIKNYLKKSQEWYFIIEDKNGEALGTIRIYDVRGDDFCWGSWLIKDGAPSQVALESMLLMYDFAFYTLKFDKVHLDIRKANRSTWRFHKGYGAKFESENEIDVFYSFCKNDYEKIREKYYKFIDRGGGGGYSLNFAYFIAFLKFHKILIFINLQILQALIFANHQIYQAQNRKRWRDE